MTKAQIFRDQSVDELEAKVVDLRRELFNVINELKKAKKNESAGKIREIKRDIARILTIIRQKNVAQQ